MRISINIDAPNSGVSPNDTTLRLNSGSVAKATEAVFTTQELKEDSPSLEGRVKRLENADDLPSDQEITTCEQKVNDLLARIQAVKFARAFPIVAELKGGK